MRDTIWRAAQERLRGELPEKDYETWIAPLRAAGWSDRTLTLETPSGFFRDWLRGRFLGVLEDAASGASGEPASVVLVVNRTLDVQLRSPARGPSRTPRPAEPPPARYSFENFVVGASNRVAYEAAAAVVTDSTARFSPLFVYGGVGLGKTHLLAAVAHALSADRQRSAVAWLTAENFVNAMIKALRADHMERFRERFRKIETLVVDDIQFLADKRRSQEEFYHTFNALHDGRKQIVIASDRAPHDMPGFQETLRSRFASGLLADIQAPDAELRVTLVERKARSRNLCLDATVISYLADGWCSNVRELEGALTRLEAFAAFSGDPVGLPLVRQALGANVPRAGGASLERIIAEVCQYFHLTRSELASPRRTARIAVPRQLAMYLCRQHTDAPLNRIGKELGGRDHSTVVHALGAIERRLAQDAALRQAVTDVQARLGS